MTSFITGSPVVASAYASEGAPSATAAVGEPFGAASAAPGSEPSRLALAAVPVPGAHRVPARVLISEPVLTAQAVPPSVPIQAVVQTPPAAAVPARVVARLPARAGAVAGRRAARPRTKRVPPPGSPRKTATGARAAMAVGPMARISARAMARPARVVGVALVAGGRAIRHVAAAPFIRRPLTFAVRPEAAATRTLALRPTPAPS